ncbi:MAG: hypothetical protein ACTSYJ_11180 [Candidatus Thorarchaeota archaeon]
MQPDVKITNGRSYSESTKINNTHLLLALVGCLVLIIGLQGILYVSMMIYSILFYRLVSWNPNHMIIGGIVTYSLFIAGVASLFLLINKLFISQKKLFDTAFQIASSLYLLLYPITPILWYDNRYSIDTPASGFLYGVANPIFPIVVGVGVIILLSSIKETRLRKLSSNISPDVISLVIFTSLALITLAISFIGMVLTYDIGFLEVRATPFTLIPNIIGLSLLVSTIIRYIQRIK